MDPTKMLSDTGYLNQIFYLLVLVNIVKCAILIF